MADRAGDIPRAKMSAAERRFRSRLAQLLSQRGVIRGTLLLRRRKCGKANCRCARGEGHESLFLAISESRPAAHRGASWPDLATASRTGPGPRKPQNPGANLVPPQIERNSRSLQA